METTQSLNLWNVSRAHGEDETGSMIFVISDSEGILVVLFPCGFDSPVIFTFDFNLLKWGYAVPTRAVKDHCEKR